jgi:hypothetical protein
MKKAIRRLRFREGDILVVKDQHIMESLRKLSAVKGVPACPIVFAPEGIKRFSRDYLERLLARAE